MPWRETCAMDEKLRFVEDILKAEWTISELCMRYGISRKTGYKWLSRYHLRGLEGLDDKSRAPDTHPNATPIEIEAAVVAFRHRHPRWGPRKLVHRLGLEHPEVLWPAPSTVGQLLKRHGLAQRRRKRTRTPAYCGLWQEARQANDVWAADFKGWFRTGDDKRVDPLTITDSASRYLIRCQGLERPRIENTQVQFEAAFREYGLPWAIRTDNGTPFASVGLGGLSRLSVWWIKLGIKPERIRPGHPEENGRHERFHRSLKDSTARPPKQTLRAQQEAFDVFKREYNEERPHESLEMDVPAQHYRPSARPYPEHLNPMEYGSEFEVRRVKHNGNIKWRGTMTYLHVALNGEHVGLKRTDNDAWTLYFGPMPLAVYDERKGIFRRIDGGKV